MSIGSLACLHPQRVTEERAQGQGTYKGGETSVKPGHPQPGGRGSAGSGAAGLVRAVAWGLEPRAEEQQTAVSQRPAFPSPALRGGAPGPGSAVHSAQSGWEGLRVGLGGEPAQGTRNISSQHNKHAFSPRNWEPGLRSQESLRIAGTRQFPPLEGVGIG